MTNKNVLLTSALKEQVSEYVWKNRIPSMGRVVQDIIREYASGELALTPEVPVPFDAELKYNAPPEYEAALLRAKREGMSLSEVIRMALALKVVDPE